MSTKYRVIKETTDYIEDVPYRIEAGDLANEMGKVYSKQVRDAIENHRDKGLQPQRTLNTSISSLLPRMGVRPRLTSSNSPGGNNAMVFRLTRISV